MNFKTLIICILLVIGVGYLIVQNKNNSTFGQKKIDIVDENPKIETLASGFQWVEGPVWLDDEQALLFSDIPANTIYRWDEKNGVTEYMKPSGYTGKILFKGREPGSNGLALDKENRLMIAEHGNRRVSRREHDGQVVEVAGKFNGKRLNSPNDIIVANNGDILFTDPPYGLPKGIDDPDKELPFQGVYRYDGKNLHLLTEELQYPNGLGLSPDEKTLYVSNSKWDQPIWVAFDYDGHSLSNKRILADASEYVKNHSGAPDGFCIDEKGNLFSSGPGGLYIISPEGEILKFIEFGHRVSNCTWGGDGSDLYITGNDTIYRMKTNTKGK